MRQSLRLYLPAWAQDWLEIIVPALQITLIVLCAWLLQYLLRRLVRRAGDHYQVADELVVPLKGFIRWSIVAATTLLVHTGSRSIELDNHAQRLAREAMFLMVFGSRPAIRSALLQMV